MEKGEEEQPIPNEDLRCFPGKNNHTESEFLAMLIEVQLTKMENEDADHFGHR